MFELLCSEGYEVLFLPPYSPFLNPLEYAFSKVKGIVCNTLISSPADLHKAIEDATQQVTTQDAVQWFEHTMHFYQQCALGLWVEGNPLKPAC